MEWLADNWPALVAYAVILGFGALVTYLHLRDKTL